MDDAPPPGTIGYDRVAHALLAKRLPECAGRFEAGTHRERNRVRFGRIMPEPTIDDYKRRLERLLTQALASTAQARAQLASEGASRGLFSDNSSGFRLQEEQLAHREFVAAMELALSECRRASQRPTLDGQALFEATRVAVGVHLDALVPLIIRPPNSAFAVSASDGGRVERTTHGLRKLMGEVFREYDHDLYVLPGDLNAPVVINVAYVQGSAVGAIQQSGSGSSQHREKE